MVYVYGYQANYTDHDGIANENNNRPKKEFKKYDFDAEKIIEGADITSLFLNSDYSYSQSQYNTTFLISNVVNFIEDEDLQAVKTNQTPLEFAENATLDTNLSFVYSTANISAAYLVTNHTLNGNKLYRASFTGKAESANGTYIYLIAYKYKNYFNTESTLSANKIFYQVF